MQLIYRVTQTPVSNQGYLEKGPPIVVYIGLDKQQAFEEYLKLEPEAGVGSPGDCGYLLDFEAADLDAAPSPDDLKWLADPDDLKEAADAASLD